jgi:hypothetical protein
MYFKLNSQIQKFDKLVGLIIFACHKANRVDFLHLYKDISGNMQNQLTYCGSAVCMRCYSINLFHEIRMG